MLRCVVWLGVWCMCVEGATYHNGGDKIGWAALGALIAKKVLHIQEVTFTQALSVE